MTIILRELPGNDPAVLGFTLPAERFNPTIHKMSQEDALEQISLFRDHNFTAVGAAEHHTGIHPTYGKCIISIYAEHASLIPFA